MPLCEGQIVCVLSGRDKGEFMIVLSVEGNTVTLSNGRERPIDKPKLKNIKHILPNNFIADKNKLLTNMSIRHTISDYLNSRRS